MSQPQDNVSVKAVVLHSATEAAGLEGGVSLNATRNPRATMTLQGQFLRVENSNNNGDKLATVLIPLTNVKFLLLK